MTLTIGSCKLVCKTDALAQGPLEEGQFTYGRGEGLFHLSKEGLWHRLFSQFHRNTTPFDGVPNCDDDVSSI